MNDREQGREEEPAQAELERLAQRMRRTPDSLQAFAGLAPEQLRVLRVAVERACAQHRRDVDEAAIPALLRPLRRLLLRLLRGGAE